MAAIELRFPIVFFHWDSLCVDTEASFEALGARFESDGSFECVASAKPGFKESPAWIVDAGGEFFRLCPVGERRAWARPLSWLVQLVRTRYRAEGPGRIAAGTLLELLEGVRDEFEEAPIAESLRSHLRKYPADKLVDSELLEQWPI